MTTATVTRAPRRGRGEDAIYWDEANDCFVGSVSLGFTPAGKRRRRTVRGDSKPEVRRKLKDLRKEIETGVTSSARYTVEEALRKWLAVGLKGKAPKTIEKFRTLIDNQIVPFIGAAKLRDLTADDLDEWLEGRAEVLTTGTLREVMSALRRSITMAQKRNLAPGRNVAELVDIPAGVPSRISKALTMAQAVALLVAAVSSRLHAYIVVSLMTGIRTEEARKLAWDRVHLDTDPPRIEVWRSVRVSGDMKTKKSRRTLELPPDAVDALRLRAAAQEKERQAAGVLWQETGLVFTSTVGTELDASNVRREFRKVVAAAGIEGSWTPRELRHSFVSLLSAAGVRIEDISQLVGHASTSVTETVYRHELRPVLTKGAEAIGRAFGGTAKTS